ncbi:MAG: hypothetical protein ACYTAQ_15610 [Planctomycetota bacterium]
MTIELSTAGPDGPWSTVAEALVDNGRYQWLVPVALPESETCYLRLTLGTSPPAVALTPAPFTILGAAEIPGDLDGDGVVGVLDFLLLLAAWCWPPGGSARGPARPCAPPTSTVTAMSASPTFSCSWPTGVRPASAARTGG